MSDSGLILGLSPANERRRYFVMVSLYNQPWDFVISSVPADGLAPLGARTSAYTVMTKFNSCIHMGLSIERLNVKCRIL